MWFLGLLPTAITEVFIYAVLAAGALGFIGSFFVLSRFAPVQRNVIQIVAALCLILGVYWKGGLAIEKEWRAKLAEAEGRVALAEERAASATARIQYVYRDRVEYIERSNDNVQAQIQASATDIDANCTIPASVPEIINSATEVTK